MAKRSTIKIPAQNIPYTDMLKSWLDILPNLPQEESDFIEKICNMNSEQKQSFLLAKKLFEDKNCFAYVLK